MKQICGIDDCSKTHQAKQHYEILRIAKKPNCKNGCNKPQAVAKYGLCRNCYAKELPFVESAKLKQYSMTIEEFEAMSILQNNQCLICGNENSISRHGTPMKLAVDHNHKTGKVRGLLCTWCNLGLGKFRDDVELLQKAIDYLNEKGK
jgi:ribosomal protein S14